MLYVRRARNTRPVCRAPVKFITQLRSSDLVNFTFDLSRITARFSVHIKTTGDNTAGGKCCERRARRVSRPIQRSPTRWIAVGVIVLEIFNANVDVFYIRRRRKMIALAGKFYLTRHHFLARLLYGVPAKFLCLTRVARYNAWTTIINFVPLVKAASQKK